MNESLSLKNIPQDLKMNGLWCCWKFVPKLDYATKQPVINKKTGEVEMSKMPFNVLTKKGAKSNDSSTFVSYPVMLQYLNEYLNVDENGVQRGGVGLGVFNGFSAIDIDHCVDSNGTLSSMAKDIVDYCQSYTEYSPSKTGIRIIFKTKKKIDKSRYYINNSSIGLEIYISENTNKFVTITGNRLNDTLSDVNNVDVQWILDKYMVRDSKFFDLNEILKKDAKLRSLWYSNAPGSHSDESNRDQALCCKLAYYCKGDATKIAQLFVQSPYYQSKDDAHKAKWAREDYSSQTIQGAIDVVGNAFSINPQPMQSVGTYSEIKSEYNLNDTGNAKRFIDEYGEVLRYNTDNKHWMIWNGNYWQHDISEQVKNYVEIMAEKMMFECKEERDKQMREAMLRNVNYIYNSAGKEAVLKEARHVEGIPTMNSDYDTQPYLLCCKTKTYDLFSGEAYKSKESDMLSMTTNEDIDLDNEPTLFLKTLNEMFQSNERVIDYLQRAFGYSISNLTKEQCMFILYGDGNNGKSLLLDVIREALGSYSISSRPQLLTEQPNGNSNLEEIARLKGKRFIVVEEAKAGDRLDESLVKSLTSGIGNQVARFLYGNSFEFAVTGKIWMATNYKPVIKGTDKGIWRRIKIIPLNVDFTGREDKDLRNKLRAETPQILGWLVKGFDKYRERGLDDINEVKDSVQAYKDEMDIVAKWISECCDILPSYFEQASVLFKNFNAYCKQNKEYELSQTLFGRNLSKKFAKRAFSGRNVYMGIRLKKKAADIEKEVEFDKTKIDEESI